MRMPKSSSGAAADRIVINSGPLIALARADLLSLVETLPFEFICPVEVRAELDARTVLGYPKAESHALAVGTDPAAHHLRDHRQGEGSCKHTTSGAGLANINFDYV
jgi:hypothetical protein